MAERSTSPAGSRPSRGRRLVFWVLAFVLAVAAIEIGARLLLRFGGWEGSDPAAVAGAEEAVLDDLDPDAEAPARAAIERLRARQAIHPFLGFVMDPDGHPQARREIRDPEAVEHGFGWSKEKIFHSPSADRAVIAVLGGSVASILAGNSGGLRRELALDRRYAGRELVIVDLADGGYKQPQQLMTLAWFLFLGAHFDTVINLDGFNDVTLAPAGLIKRGVFPFFPQNWHLRVASLDRSMRLAAGELTFLRAERRRRAQALAGSLIGRSAVARLAWSIDDRRLARRIAAREEELAGAKSGAGRSYQAQGPRREYASRAAMLEDLTEGWKRGSLLLADLCAARGIAYFHFLQPNQYVPGSKPLSAAERRRAWLERSPYRPGVEDGYPLLIARGAELRAAGVEFHDLSRIFADVTEDLYVDPCCHFNRRGNLLLGEAMGRRIRASGES